MINLQDILHVGYERRIGIRRDDALLLQVRLERVFFSVRPIVLSLARPTMFSSTTAVSSSFSVHRARPAGGLEQATAISLDSAATSTMRWRIRASVATLISRAAAIWLSLHPSPASEASAFNRMRAFNNWCARCLP